MIEAQIKQTDPVTVAFLLVHGPYAQMPDAFGKLYHWVDHYGLQPAGNPHALFITDAHVTPEDAAEWEVWAPIAGGAGVMSPDETGFGVKRIEPKIVAAAMYRGPYEGVAQTYDELSAWLETQSYRVVGPSEEVYLSDPATVPPKDYLTEIQLPVTKV